MKDWSDEQLMYWLVEMRLEPMYGNNMAGTSFESTKSVVVEEDKKTFVAMMIGFASVGLLVLTNIIVTLRMGKKNQKADEDDIKTVADEELN